MSSNDRITCKLDDILEKTIDNRGKNPPFSISGFPYIDTTCIVGNSRHPDYSLIRKYVSGKTYRNWFRSGHPQKGDLLIATVGANIGQICLMDETIACVAQNTIGLRVNRKKVNPHYIYYLLSSRAYQDYLKSLDVGSAQPSIKVPHLLGINVEVLSLNIQNKIVDTFSILDDKIELNIQMNKTLEAIGQALFKHWFVDFEFPNEKGKPYESSGGEMVDSELGEMPKGWSIVENISDICEKINYGYTQSASKKIVGPKFLRVTDINKGDWINWNSVPYCEIGDKDLAKYILKRMDIVIARMADPGKIAIFESDIRTVFASYLIRIRFKDPLQAYYLYYLMKSRYYQNYILGASTGTVQKSLNAKGLTNGLSIVIPDKAILRKFNDVIILLRGKVNINLSENNNLSRIRDSLLPRLMSGRIRVPIGGTAT